MTLLAQFVFANIHFILSIFSALVFFTAGWLYLDAWRADPSKKTPAYRGIGFFLLAISCAMHATAIDLGVFLLATQLIKSLSLVVIWLSLYTEPVLHLPAGTKTTEYLKSVLPFAMVPLFLSLVPLSATLFLIISLTYFRKASEGFEKQLKSAGWAFLFLALSEFISIVFKWNTTTNVFYSNLLSLYGPVWLSVHILELVGLLILFRWVWGYIRFRLQSQLFILSIAISLVVFLTTTALFTFLLFRNIENDALSHLKTDVKILQYTVERLQEEALTNANAVAADSAVRTVMKSGSPDQLYEATANYFTSQKADFLTITSTDGTVLMRTEDKDKRGDNVATDPIIASALEGRQLSTVSTRFGVLSPVVEIRAAVPVKESTDSGRVLGVVSTGFIIDDAFVDGVKEITGLDVTIFADDKRSATTFVGPDGRSRSLGTKEANKTILDTVLNKGEIYSGASQVLHQPYYTSYSPLKTLGGKPIGMLFVGKPQTALVDTARKSIDLTFLGSVLLMMLSIFPAYLISRYINEQLES